MSDSATPHSPHEPLILTAADPVVVSQMGGKAAALARLGRDGFPVPGWCVLTPRAFEISLTESQRSEITRCRSAEAFASALAELRPAPAILQALESAVSALDSKPSQEALFAVRSSGADEDSAGFAFAGQFESYLFVPRTSLATKISEVWKSGFNERVLAYRAENDLGAPAAPAVLVQAMVDADAAGVAFSADPVTGRRSIAVVSATFGLGTSLVGGDADADTYRVRLDEDISEREIADKRLAHAAAPGTATGVRDVEIPEERRNHPAITDDQVRAIARLARQAQVHFGRPQDIEWTISSGRVYLLQSRPITSLQHLADPDGLRRVWDNSNIVESYSGVTTPLTFTFALNAYEGVYREFCRILGVAPQKIKAHEMTFRRMLGMVRGRVYYNLLNWYRVLSLLPGFTANREFMEGMMGVREGLPEEIIEELARDASGSAKFLDRLRMIRAALGIVGHHHALQGTIRDFYGRLNEALAPLEPPLELRRIDQLGQDYRDLEAKLLTRWDAPLINDFLAMIFFGTLGKLTSKWCGDADGTLQNDLVSGQGGMISAEPAERVLAMARRVRLHGDPEVGRVLREDPPLEAERAVAAIPELEDEVRTYLDRFGDRCLDELKLESSTLRDDPTPLLRAIGNTAQVLASDGSMSRRPAENLSGKAEERARRAIGGNLVRRAIFTWVLRNARDRVRDRENLRFERTRLFGRVRRIFVEIANRLAAEGKIDDPRDLFYLECGEILAYLEGASTTDDLRGLAGVRRHRFESYEEESRPSDRFETHGAVHLGNTFLAPNDLSASPEGPTPEAANELRGTGACPGVVRGPVRVIRDPRGASLAEGNILVAERTDPGWILLFPSASAILVERGSLLSHSAIVAREMGIPAIVSIAGVTTRLRDGDLVEMDGSTGRVRILERAPETSG